MTDYTIQKERLAAVAKAKVGLMDAATLLLFALLDGVRLLIDEANKKKGEATK